MKALWICLFLLCAGLFVSSSLYLTEATGGLIPCGVADGCAKVKGDAWAHIAGIPISLIGLLGYLIITALVLFCRPTPAVQGVATLLMLCGSSVSIALMFRSALVIHAVCLWCMTSAFCICLLLFVYSNFLYGQERRRTIARRDTIPVLVLLFASLLASVGVAQLSKKDPYQGINQGLTPALIRELTSPQSKSFGDNAAPVTIVMFGDFQCPTCHEVFLRILSLVEKRKDTRFIFVNSPLQDHDFGTYAGVLGEIAAEKGKFWEYAVFVMSQKSLSSEDAEEKVRSYGVDRQHILRAIMEGDIPPVKRFNRDLRLGSELGLSVTPVVILLKNGMKPQVLRMEKLGSADSIEAEITR